MFPLAESSFYHIFQVTLTDDFPCPLSRSYYVEVYP